MELIASLALLTVCNALMRRIALCVIISVSTGLTLTKDQAVSPAKKTAVSAVMMAPAFLWIVNKALIGTKVIV